MCFSSDCFFYDTFTVPVSLLGAHTVTFQEISFSFIPFHNINGFLGNRIKHTLGRTSSSVTEAGFNAVNGRPPPSTPCTGAKRLRKSIQKYLKLTPVRHVGLWHLESCTDKREHFYFRLFVSLITKGQHTGWCPLQLVLTICCWTTVSTSEPASASVARTFATFSLSETVTSAWTWRATNLLNAWDSSLDRREMGKLWLIIPIVYNVRVDDFGIRKQNPNMVIGVDESMEESDLEDPTRYACSLL